jgi:NADPH:quinone reductase
MRAAVVTRLAGPDAVTVMEVPQPSPAPGEVLVEVHAAGISFPDLLLSQGRYQIRREPPFTLGVECTGVVREAPPASGLAEGQRVVVDAPGCCAELVAASPDDVFPLPDALSMGQGVALLMNYHTAHFGLVRRGRLRAGETLLVHGAAGGVGSAAVDLGSALGARVIAVCSDPGKAEIATRLGAEHTVPTGEGWLQRVRELGAGGVDVVFDPVGGQMFDDTVRALAPEGRLVVIGFAGGGIPTLAMNRVLFRNIDVVGAGWGAFLEKDPGIKRPTHHALVELAEAGRIAPHVGAELPLERAADALRLLAERKATGKVVLRVTPPR